MSTFWTLPARQRLQIIGAAVLAVLALIVVLAVVVPVAALALLVVTLVGSVTMVAERVAMTRARRQTAQPRRAPDAAPVAQPTLRLELADGEVLSARPVPLPHQDEHTMLLTRDGYVIVNGEGRVLHRI